MKKTKTDIPDHIASPALPEEKFQLQLQRYHKIGQQNVSRTDEARRWAAGHNIEDMSLFERLGILWSAGDLPDKLPSDPATRKEFIQSGLLDGLPSISRASSIGLDSSILRPIVEAMR